METVRLSSKGQFIVPKAIRDRHHWDAGTEFVIIDRGGELVVRPTKVFPPTELEPADAPSLYQGEPLSLEEMEQAGFSRKIVAQRLYHILGLPNIEMEDAPHVAQAIAWYESGMDFADALHLAGSDELTGFVTFDRSLVKAAKHLDAMAPVRLLE